MGSGVNQVMLCVHGVKWIVVWCKAGSGVCVSDVKWVVVWFKAGSGVCVSDVKWVVVCVV